MQIELADLSVVFRFLDFQMTQSPRQWELVADQLRRDHGGRAPGPAAAGRAIIVGAHGAVSEALSLAATGHARAVVALDPKLSFRDEVDLPEPPPEADAGPDSELMIQAIESKDHAALSRLILHELPGTLTPEAARVFTEDVECMVRQMLDENGPFPWEHTSRRLVNISLPLLVVGGIHHQMTSRQQAIMERVAAFSPDSTLVDIPSQHGLPWLESPGALADKLVEFARALPD